MEKKKSCVFYLFILLSPENERERELEREICRNTETTSHGECIDPNWIGAL